MELRGELLLSSLRWVRVNLANEALVGGYSNHILCAVVGRLTLLSVSTYMEDVLVGLVICVHASYDWTFRIWIELLRGWAVLAIGDQLRLVLIEDRADISEL